MIKFLGALMLILGSGVIGLVIARNYSLRPQQIRYLQNGIQMLETEILYGLTPLPQALVRTGKKLPFPINNFFINVAENLNKGECLTASEAWELALENLKEESVLLSEDLEILLYFGQNLGGSDREEQAKSLKLVKEQLKNLEIKAEYLKDKNKKLWQYLGFSLGIVIAIILF